MSSLPVYLRFRVPLELLFFLVLLRLRIVTLYAIIIYLVTVTNNISFFSVLLVDCFFTAVIVLTPSIKSSSVACKQQTNGYNYSNPKPLNLPFHSCHGRFMHDIGYVFWRAFHVFTGFAVCHNLTPKYFLCLQKFGRGKGKGGFFPCGVAITVPHQILAHEWNEINFQTAIL